MSDKILRLEKFAQWLSIKVNWIAGIGLVVMLGLTVSDIIGVEFFVMRMPKRAQAGVIALVSLLGIVLFGLLAWQSYEFGCTLQVTGEVSMTQGIPFYPFVYAIAFCCIPICLLLFVDLLKSVTKAVNK